MDIKSNLEVKSMTIEALYKVYKESKVVVNRRYQRKLVWTIEEKKAFIDSIIREYPVPLFLLAEVSYRGDNVYEIIDGMQRLNAVMDFIEGEFPVDGKYFDLETNAFTNSLLKKKELRQNTPVLDNETCTKIAGYQLPISLSSFPDDSIIDEIFKRINSNGKHLSPHEIRQAGSQTIFAHLVRVLAESIRKDVSHSDILTLNNMKQISITNHQLHYGINLGGIFWSKHGIITNDNIRDSRDEEMIAHMLGAILVNPRPNATAYQLDEFYQEGSKIDDIILQYGESTIIDKFEAVFEEIRKTFESTGSSFAKVLFKNPTKHVNHTFQAFFLAFYELLVDEQKKIDSYQELCKSLEGIGDTFFTDKADRLNLSKEREQATAMAKGLMSRYFSNRQRNDPALSNGMTRFRNLLSCSVTENTNYDFKIGFHRLDERASFDEKCLKKIVCTLTAMVNQGKGSVGYVIVGVADKKEDADRFKSLYNSSPRQYQHFYVTGVQEEAKQYKSHDDYNKFIKEKIKYMTEIDESFKSQILSKVEYLQFYDKSVLIFRAENLGDPVKFDGKFHERKGTNTEVVEDKIIWKRFV